MKHYKYFDCPKIFYPDHLHIYYNYSATITTISQLQLMNFHYRPAFSGCYAFSKHSRSSLLAAFLCSNSLLILTQFPYHTTFCYCPSFSSLFMESASLPSLGTPWLFLSFSDILVSLSTFSVHLFSYRIISADNISLFFLFSSVMY